jgi:hypothetical protein
MGLATKIYSVRFETYLFVASYDSQGYGGDLSDLLLVTDCLYIESSRIPQKTPLILVAYCCTRYPAMICLPRICLRGNFYRVVV